MYVDALCTASVLCSRNTEDVYNVYFYTVQKRNSKRHSYYWTTKSRRSVSCMLYCENGFNKPSSRSSGSDRDRHPADRDR